MSSEHQSLSSIQMVNIPDVDHFHFTIITATWNSDITSALEQGCIDTLKQNGVSDERIRIIRVPGSWELISAARNVITMTNTSAVICIGAVIQGGTPHFEYICQGVTDGLARLCSTQDVPVIYGVLTLNTMEQAIERSGGRLGNKGDEAAITALEMANMRRELSKNP
ncbi:MAG: 6,7-dimethyl-8-ribityllumazine synthase [Bacteroidia bacterium]